MEQKTPAPDQPGIRYVTAEHTHDDLRKMLAPLVGHKAPEVGHLIVAAQVLDSGIAVISTLDCTWCESGFMAETIMHIAGTGHNTAQQHPPGLPPDTELAGIVTLDKTRYDYPVPPQWKDNPIPDTGELALFLGGSGDDFTGHLMRLFDKADPVNFNRLATKFPREALAFKAWMMLTEPTMGQLSDTLARWQA